MLCCAHPPTQPSLSWPLSLLQGLDDQQLRLYNPKTNKDSVYKFDRVFGEASSQVRGV